jgi:hypothetical protein
MESLEQDCCKELKQDLETAQMEVDELRIELEDTKAAQAAAAAAALLLWLWLLSKSAATTTAASDHSSNEAQDMTQSLNVQNALLCKALI